MSFWDEKEVKRLFQELPFHNVLIEKACVKCVKNMDLLQELPFYDELIIVEYQKHLKDMEEVIGLI